MGLITNHCAVILVQIASCGQPGVCCHYYRPNTAISLAFLTRYQDQLPVFPVRLLLP